MKPTVLILVGHYLPGSKAGGPIRSIANLVAALGEEFDFRIVTSDRDLGDESAYSNVRAGAWNPVGDASVRYVAPEDLGAEVPRAAAEIEPDLVYAQSYFSPATSVRPRLASWRGRLRAPLLVAPRGEFSPGALLQKGAKKRAFLAASRVLGLDRGVLWHSTAPTETEDIRRTLGPRAEIFEAPAIPSPGPDAPLPRAKSPGRLEAAFISRVSPKKNLDGAIRLLRGVPGARLTVYGPKEDAAYWRRCLALAAESGVEVADGGALRGDEVADAFGRAHVFLFPTLGENYGHAIMESLQAGTPVIVSDRTPWRGLREAGVGWDLPLEDEVGFRAALAEVCALDAEGFAVLSARAFAYARARTEDPGIVAASRDLLAWALDKRR